MTDMSNLQKAQHPESSLQQPNSGVEAEESLPMRRKRDSASISETDIRASSELEPRLSQSLNSLVKVRTIISREGSQELKRIQTQGEAAMVLGKRSKYIRVIGRQQSQLRSNALLTLVAVLFQENQYTEGRKAFQQWLAQATAEESHVKVTEMSQLNFPLSTVIPQESERVTFLDKLIKTCRDSSLRQNLAESLRVAAEDHRQNGHRHKAIKLYQEAAGLFHILNLQEETGRTLNAMGVAYTEERNFIEAQHIFEESRRIFQVLQKRLGLSKALHNLGLTLIEEHRYVRAAHVLTESVQLRRDLGLGHTLAPTLFILGIDCVRAGKYPEAAQVLEEALNSSDNVSHVTESGLKELREIYRTLGWTSQLLHTYCRQAAFYEGTNLKLERIAAYNCAGSLFLAQGKFSEAAEYLIRSATQCRELGHQYKLAQTLDLLCQVSEQQQDWGSAIVYAQESTILFQDKESPEFMYAMQRLGNLWMKTECTEEALIVYQQCSAFFLSHGAPQETLDFLENMLFCLNSQLSSHPDNKRPVHIPQPEPSSTHLKNLVFAIGLAYKRLKRYEQAAHFFEKSVNQRQRGKETRELAVSLSSLGKTYLRLGGEDNAWQAANALEESQKLRTDTVRLKHLAQAYYRLGKYQLSSGNAIDYFIKAEGLYRLLNSKLHLSKTLYYRAYAKGMNAFAMDLSYLKPFYIESIEIAEAIHAELHLSRVLLHFGKFLNQKKQTKQAVPVLKRGIRLFRKTGNLRKLAEALRELGQSLTTHCKSRLAIAAFAESAEVFESLNKHFECSQVLTVLGNCLEKEHFYTRAVDIYKKLVKVFKELNDLKALIQPLHRMANIYKKQGLYQNALDVFTSLITTYSSLQTKAELAAAHTGIGDVYACQAELLKSIEAYSTALLISPNVRYDILRKRGLAYQQLGDDDNACSDLKRCMSFFHSSREIALDLLISCDRLGNYPRSFRGMQHQVGPRKKIVPRLGPGRGLRKKFV